MLCPGFWRGEQLSTCWNTERGVGAVLALTEPGTAVGRGSGAHGHGDRTSLWITAGWGELGAHALRRQHRAACFDTSAIGKSTSARRLHFLGIIRQPPLCSPGRRCSPRIGALCSGRSSRCAGPPACHSVDRRGWVPSDRTDRSARFAFAPAPPGGARRRRGRGW